MASTRSCVLTSVLVSWMIWRPPNPSPREQDWHRLTICLVPYISQKRRVDCIWKNTATNQAFCRSCRGVVRPWPNFDQLLCSGHPCLIQKPSSANQATLWLTLCLRFEDSSKSNIHGVAWPHVQHGVTGVTGVTPTFRTRFVWYIHVYPIYPYFTSNGSMSGPRWVHVVRYLASNLRPEPLHTSPQFGMFDDNVWLCLAAFMAGFVGAALFDAQLSISSAKLKCQQPQWTQWCEPLPTRPIRCDLRDHGCQRKQLSKEQLGRLGMLGRGGFSDGARVGLSAVGRWKIIGLSQICCG